MLGYSTETTKDRNLGGGIDVPYDQGTLPECRVLDMSKPQTTSYRFVFH
jgi:hypothetical protein